ncbi:MAG: hypothetical protein ACFFDW_14405 [Candidatus Thorarchaeota archaeon]
MSTIDENLDHEAIIERIRKLIADKEEVNLEWLKTVTQIPPAIISKIVIQELGMVVLDGRIYSKEKAERRLQQIQQTAQLQVDREAFRKGPVYLDMVSLREKLWTARFPMRILGQERHQFCPIWSFLEEQASSIILRYDWKTRFENHLSQGTFNNMKTYELTELINDLGDNFKGKGYVIFAHTENKDTVFGKGHEMWVMFLVIQQESGIRVEGLDMVNILSLSTLFRSRELAYKALNEYLEMINFIVSDPSIFDQVIIGL